MTSLGVEVSRAHELVALPLLPETGRGKGSGVPLATMIEVLFTFPSMTLIRPVG